MVTWLESDVIVIELLCNEDEDDGGGMGTWRVVPGGVWWKLVSEVEEGVGF